jgi:hypothetical protein
MYLLLAIICIALLLFILLALAIATFGVVVLWRMHRKNVSDPFE